MLRTILLAAALTAAVAATAKPAEPNPLLAPWAGPYGGVRLPPNDPHQRVVHEAPPSTCRTATTRSRVCPL